MVYEETISITDASEPVDYQKYVYGLSLSSSNTFYFTIGTSPTTKKSTLSKVKFELIAPNAECLNNLSPFNVDYFNGKYYISDCSGGTAKIAEIDVANMYNMDNLTWTDTGIYCWQYKTSFYLTKYGSDFQPDHRIDYYITDDGCYLHSGYNNSTRSNKNVWNLDWMHIDSTGVCYAASFNKYTSNKYLQLTSPTGNLIQSGRISGSMVDVCSVKFLENFFESRMASSLAVFSNANRQLYLNVITSTTNTIFTFANGINPHCYFDKGGNTVVNCFYKHYDKILKTRVRFSNSTYTLMSTEEIGAYEEYFEGVNNDYFVVKNGVLEYHKKPINNE